ncbi:MAG: RNA pseudouridine synthase [Burkholderiales bacterium]|nr:MAG: RNA pseudouridine synthase [Betaproteobacteria bacterium]TAG28428.1 MAG: RNA pseudouridine synthase [Burkholderiales bacterium]
MAALEIIHVDDAFIIVNKPSGLLSVPGRGPDKADCAISRLQQQFSDALTVHRLDMETSGLMVFARGIDAQRALSRAFEKREVTKRYVAVVDGIVRADSGEIDLPLICDWPNRPRQIVDHDVGKPSLTRYQILSRNETSNTTKVELSPVTGRSHQLRVHLASIGHCILGDSLYATPAALSASERLLLHASSLTFAHPICGRQEQFECSVSF